MNRDFFQLGSNPPSPSIPNPAAAGMLPDNFFREGSIPFGVSLFGSGFGDSSGRAPHTNFPPIATGTNDDGTYWEHYDNGTIWIYRKYDEEGGRLIYEDWGRHVMSLPDLIANYSSFLENREKFTDIDLAFSNPEELMEHLDRKHNKPKVESKLKDYERAINNLRDRLENDDISTGERNAIWRRLTELAGKYVRRGGNINDILVFDDAAVNDLTNALVDTGKDPSLLMGALLGNTQRRSISSGKIPPELTGLIISVVPNVPDHTLWEILDDKANVIGIYDEKTGYVRKLVNPGDEGIQARYVSLEKFRKALNEGKDSDKEWQDLFESVGIQKKNVPLRKNYTPMDRTDTDQLSEEMKNKNQKGRDNAGPYVKFFLSTIAAQLAAEVVGNIVGAKAVKSGFKIIDKGVDQVEVSVKKGNKWFKSLLNKSEFEKELRDQAKKGSKAAENALSKLSGVRKVNGETVLVERELDLGPRSTGDRIDRLIEGTKPSTKGKLYNRVEKHTYGNPGTHDPHGGTNKYDTRKSILPDNHIELFEKAVPFKSKDGKISYWAIEDTKKGKVLHRFQSDGSNRHFHWNGSTNGKLLDETPRSIKIKDLPKAVKLHFDWN